MKKQLMIAAVAATMISVPAMADISISGSSTATFSSTAGTNTTALDAEIVITGTGGGATVTATMDLENGDTDGAELSMNAAGVDLVVSDDSLSAGMTMGAITVTYSSAANVSAITLAADMGGMGISHKTGSAGSTTGLSGSLAGFDASFETNTVGTADATTRVGLSGAVGGISLAYSKNAHGDDQGTTVSATMDMGGNAVTLKRLDDAGDVTNSVSMGAALAGGADLTATWSNDGTADTLKVAVAVSF